MMPPGRKTIINTSTAPKVIIAKLSEIPQVLGQKDKE